MALLGHLSELFCRDRLVRVGARAGAGAGARARARAGARARARAGGRAGVGLRGWITATVSSKGCGLAS